VLRHRLGIDPGDVVILYAGSFAGYQNADVLAGAASIVLARNDGVHFVFVGFTDAAEEVAFASALGPAAGSPRVSLVRRVPPGDLHTYKALADILLSTRGLVRNVPIKLFELLATGKPIVANAVPAHTAVLDSTRAMLVRSAPDAYAAGISRLLEDRALARRLGCNAAAFAAERLGWTQFRSLIADVYASARPGARPERGKRRPAMR
jgi:glycosyltransferase involved in cell wall biosynthesis